MINTRTAYANRLREVEIYFELLQFLDKGQCFIRSVDILGNTEEKEIDNELSTIMKAHGFLLLYNLVEATIRNSIVSIVNNIHASSITYKQLSDNLRKLWVKQENRSTNNEKLLSLINNVLEDNVLRFEKDCINISGNIDAQEIRNILKQLGGNEIKDGRNLKIIKDKRNHLAHGEFSFAEVGKDYSVKELIEYKESTKEYLDQVLDEIQNYIESRKFAR